MIQKQSLLLLMLSFSALVANAQISFGEFFENKSLRLDYTIAGTTESYDVFFEQLKEEPHWGGSKVNLIDKFRFGDYMLEVFDKASGTMIYSRGYSSLFYEWLDTPEAKSGFKRSYYESVQIPYPKKEINLKIKIREKNNNFREIYTIDIKPDNIFIKKDKQTAFDTQKLHYSGNPNKKLDIVIIPDGYTKDEMKKFRKDCDRFIGYFFDVEPFKSNKDKVNFWAVEAESEESGTDVPGKNIWKNTILDTHFYTFNYARYLTCPNVKKLRDLAAYTPYDQIYILVNTETYGGGGIYNYYNLCVSDHKASEEVFTHEFGHAFAALADEYQYGHEKASDIYDMSVEPWQVNITNLSNFESKWADMVKNHTPIPTPDTDEYKNKIGAFEGAGYVKKGIYRPTHNCKMRSNSVNEFCPVCYKAVYDLLMFYAK